MLDLLYIEANVLFEASYYAILRLDLPSDTEILTPSSDLTTTQLQAHKAVLLVCGSSSQVNDLFTIKEKLRFNA